MCVRKHSDLQNPIHSAFEDCFCTPRASSHERERRFHLLTTAALAPQAFPPATHTRPRDGEPLSVDTCTKVEWSCMFAVNSRLIEKDCPYLCRLDASEPDPKLYILQLCVSASSCFLFSPLLPLTSFRPFLSFTLSLSPSLNTCVSLLVWQLKTLLSLALSRSSCQRGSNWRWCQWWWGKWWKELAKKQRDKCPKKRGETAVSSLWRRIETAGELQLWSLTEERCESRWGAVWLVTLCARRIGVRMREVVSYSINLE